MYNIFDLHNDFFTEKKFLRSKQNYFNKSMRVAKSIATVVWTTNFDAKSAMQTISKANNFANSNDGAFLAIEDMHFVSKQNLAEIINMHPKYCGLTWNYNNNLAGGALDYGPMTEYGQDVVKALEENDIFVDTAHLNEKSFMTLANITIKPMFCSHTASYEVCAHARNLKDYQIKIITETNGLVGICLVSDFLTGKRQSSILDYVNHIDYLVCKFGIDYFAIGTDFNGTKHLPNGINSYKDLQKQLSQKLELIGYSPKDINKLFFENAKKFFE